MNLAQRQRSIWFLLAAYFFSLIPSTMLTPLTSILLAQRGVEPAVIGAYAASGFVALMFSSLFAIRLVGRFGERRAYLTTNTVLTLAVGGYALTDRLEVWFVLAVIVGAMGAVGWVVAESWVAELAPSEAKGRFIGLFETAIGAAAFLGPAVLLVTGTAGGLPFAVAFGLRVIGALALSQVQAPERPTAGGRVRGRVGDVIDEAAVETEAVSPAQPPSRFALLKTMPLIVLAAVVGGIFETGTTAILPVYAVGIGLAGALAASVVTAVGLGSFIFQYPLGQLADRFDARRVLLGSATVMLLTSLLLPLAAGGWLLWALAFVFGGVGGGLYTLAMIQISHQFSGPALMRATSLLVFIYSLGTAVGPSLGGVALELSPRYGLAGLFALVSALGLLGMLWAGRNTVVLAGGEARKAN